MFESYSPANVTIVQQWQLLYEQNITLKKKVQLIKNK